MLLLSPYVKAPAFITLSLAMVLLSLAACGNITGPTPEQHIEAAKNYQDKGEFESAIIELKNALLQAPDSIEARWLLGKIYLETGGTSQAAEKELRKATELGMAPNAVAIPLTRALLLQAKYQQAINLPVNPTRLASSEQAELWALKGDAYFGLGKLDRAQEWYQKALSVNADSPDAKTGTARVAAAKKNFDEAREQLTDVIETNPTFAPAWSLLGNIEKYEKKAKEAESAYSKAITLRANNGADLINRALVRIYLKDFDAARNDLEKAKKLVSRHPTIPYTQGLLHFAQGDYDKAEIAFQETLELDRNHMPAVYYLGASYLIQGQSEQSAHQIRRFHNKYPNSDMSIKLMASLYLFQGKYEAAESILMPLLARKPGDVTALNLMAAAAIRSGENKENIVYLRRVVAQQPESANTYMQLGLSLMTENENQEALESFSKAKELLPSKSTSSPESPPNPELMEILALLQAKEYDKAIAAAEQLSEKQPDNPDPITLMGGAYLAKGDEPSARTAFHRALKVAPGDPSATDNLAKLELRAGNTQEARRLYEDLLQHHPAHLATLLALVKLDKDDGQIENVIRRLEYAVQEHPETLQPKVQLASYYLRANQPDRALALMQSIPDEQATSPFVLGLVGEAQMALGQIHSAVNTFKRLVKILPGSARAHYLLAQAYGQMGDPEKSLSELAKVLDINPGHLQSEIKRIRILRLLNRQDEAARYLSELDPKHADHPEVLTEAGWLAMQDHPEDAVSAFEKALKQKTSSEMVVALGVAKWKAGNKQGSIETYTDWLEQHPTDTQVLYHLANSRLQLGQSREAIVAFDELLEQSPNHTIALNNLAWLLRESQPNKAYKHAKRAVEIAPEWAPAVDTLGILTLDRGDSKEAVSILAKASELAPENLDIRYHLALAMIQQGEKSQAQDILEALLAEQSQFENRQKAKLLLQSLAN